MASYAEDTKGIWASSYLFVYMAKQIIRPMYKKRDFLLPQWSPAGSHDKDMRMFAPQSGAGLCPDRYIFRAEEGDFDTLTGICDKVYKETSGLIAEKINEDKNLIEDYLRHSIKIYFCEREFDAGTDEQSIVEQCGILLNAMECEDLFPPREECNYFKKFFADVNDSFLTKDTYGEERNKKDNRLIKTILEYSAGELSGKAGINLVKFASGDMKMPSEVRTYHKYIAIVKADGDNMGKTLEAIYGDSKHTIHDLDKQLLEYNLKVGGLIRGFGGVPIFTGGDDLLFFAPVVYNENTIFRLLQDIDKAFNEHMRAVGSSTVPTLSFGLSMSYYKFPMFEAVETAETLLQKAKNSTGGKNRIVWSLRKHSGQTIEGMMDKSSQNLYGDLVELIQEHLYIPEKEWLSSLVYWLAKEENMLTTVVENDKMLQAYMENNFNEDVHGGSKGNLLGRVMEFMKKHMLTLSGKEARSSVLRTLYASLRFVSFINGNER